MFHTCCAGLLTVCCLLAMGADTTAQKGVFQNSKGQTTTVKADKFVFSYSIDGGNLVAELSYPTSGWVAVGFNPTKMMKDGNFILGTVIQGKALLSDDFGIDEWSHKPDTVLGGKNDILAGDCQIKDGVMTMSFTIPLNSGDAKDAVLEKGKPVKIIFAAGRKPDFGSKHSALGKTTITLKGTDEPILK